MALIPTWYAKVNATQARPDGSSIVVHRGQPWWADDPFVAEYRWMFSPDPRWGLRFTQIPPGWEDPPAAEDLDEPAVPVRRVKAGTP